MGSSTPLRPHRLRAVTDYVLSSGTADPARWAQDLVASIGPAAGARRLRRQVQGRISAVLAFRQHQQQASGRVWRQALAAVLADPPWLRNRGLLRIGLEDLLGIKAAGLAQTNE
jgi:hypothetical protein